MLKAVIYSCQDCKFITAQHYIRDTHIAGEGHVMAQLHGAPSIEVEALDKERTEEMRKAMIRHGEKKLPSADFRMKFSK